MALKRERPERERLVREFVSNFECRGAEIRAYWAGCHCHCHCH